MEKQLCRVCRTGKNLKYTTKELRQLNKKQLLLANAAQKGQGNTRASKQLLLTTPTLGNICKVCDERIQIFHRIDDNGHDSCSDVEIEVVENTKIETLPMRLIHTAIPNADFVERALRPETPVIVDDDDMLFNIFMQKFDQKSEIRQQLDSSQKQIHQQSDIQFINHFQTPYTPPQSSTSGSEGDESKVIEVLTSRESTPAPTEQTQSAPCPDVVDAQGHRIVAIIELDDGDENEHQDNKDIPSVLLTPATSSLNELSFKPSYEHRSELISPNKNKQGDSQPTIVEDEDEIEFRKVDVVQENSSATKKRKRKSYNEKELRLVASLSLVSSDSESEDNPTNIQIKKPSCVAIKTPPPLFAQKSVFCSVCKVKFPNSESLSVHERIHQGVKCTLCQVGFQSVKRLIYHMRRKHREYNGNALSEKPRTAQDSCMTIRLRYMQRTTFYECQLCGRIDEIFREHKEHIMEKHANESKTLKDPIMKQLKCPVCKAKCGAQYLSLCRHLISSHEYLQYKNHLRELVHVSAFGWNAVRQQEVAKTAKIFQFVKRKTFFFECKICRKIVAGYLHHIRHVNQHQTLPNKNTKFQTTTFNKTRSSKTNSFISTKPNISTVLDIKKLAKNLQKDSMPVTKKFKKVANKSKSIIHKTNLNNKSINLKNAKKVKKTLKSKENIQKLKLKTKQTEYVKKSLKIEKSKTILSANPIERKAVKQKSNKNLKTKLKPKDKKRKQIPSEQILTKVRPKKDKVKAKIKPQEKLKGKSKEKIKDAELKSQVKKVKIKTPIRQIDIQKYKCKYCLKKIKGFRLFNLHLLQQHKENEYTKCNKCNKLYTSSSCTLKQHVEQCPQQMLPVSKQNSRKFPKKSQISQSSRSQECENKVPNNCNEESSTNIKEKYQWLRDLLKLNQESSEISKDNSLTNTALFIPKKTESNLQCCYCLHLFANYKVLEEHKKEQHSQRPDILIKYKPIKAMINK